MSQRVGFKDKYRVKKPRPDRVQESKCSAPHIEEALRQQRLNESQSTITHVSNINDLEFSPVISSPAKKNPIHQRIPGFYYDEIANRYFKLTKETKEKAKISKPLSSSSGKTSQGNHDQYSRIECQSHTWIDQLRKRSIFTASRCAEAARCWSTQFSEAVLSRPDRFHVISRSLSHSRDMVGVASDVTFHSYFGVATVTQSGYVSLTQCRPSRSCHDEYVDESDNVVQYHALTACQTTLQPLFIGASIEETVKFVVWLPVDADPAKHVLAIVLSGARADSLQLLKFAKHPLTTNSHSGRVSSSSTNQRGSRTVLTHKRGFVVKESIESILYCPHRHCLYLGTSNGLRVLSLQCLTASVQSNNARFLEPCLGVTQGYEYAHSSNFHVPVTALWSSSSTAISSDHIARPSRAPLYNSVFAGLRNGHILMFDDREFSAARVCRLHEPRLDQLTIASMPACLDSVALLSDGVSLLALDRTAKLSLFDIRRPRLEMRCVAPATKTLRHRRFMLPTYGHRDAAVALAHPSVADGIGIYSLSSIGDPRQSLLSTLDFPADKNEPVSTPGDLTYTKLGSVCAAGDGVYSTPVGPSPWSGLCAVSFSATKTMVVHIY